MEHRHITSDLLRAALSGEISAAELVFRLIQHLEEICPSCQDGLDEFAEERMAEAYESLENLLSPRLLAAVRAAENRRRQVRPTATEELDELTRLPRGERRLKIVRSRKRFRNPYLVDRLLHHSRERLNFDPGEALELADLAAEVAARVPVSEYGEDLVEAQGVRAGLFKANALRAGGDLKAAEELLDRAIAALWDLPDPLLQAEILSFAASLRKDQRRLDEAEAMLEVAAEIYQELGSEVQLGLILAQKASIAYYRGEPETGIEILRQALPMLTPEGAPRQALFARHNLAWYLCEMGDAQGAAKLLEANRDLYRRFPDPWTQLRLYWLEGKLAASRGDVAVAEERLVEARNGFAKSGIGYDVAMISLDLAMLYAHQGRSGDMKRLAEEMLQIFQSQEIHREAMAAFLVLRQAALAEVVTTQMIQDLTTYLRNQQAGNSSMRHEIPS